MPLFCKACGETDKFDAFQDYTKRGYEVVYLNKEGDVEDYGDATNEETNVDDIRDIRCSECNAYAEEMEDSEILDYQIKHTNNTDGTWSKEELPENLQSKELLLKNI